MAYKFNEAREAGVSDTDIVEHLKSKGEYTYKFDDARKAGVSDTDIVNHLMTKEVPKIVQEEDIVPATKEEVQPVTPTGPIKIGQPQYTQPEDVKATIPVTLDTGTFTAGEAIEGQPPIDITTPEYIPESESQRLEVEELDKRMKEAQELATSSSFPQTIKHPTTGEDIVVQPGGIETDLPILVGKLATMRFITPKMEKAFGLEIGNILSKEAQLILSRNPQGLSPEEAVEILKNVPKDDQALALANRLGHETLGSIKQAVAGTDKDSILLANELKNRQQILLNTIGPVDIKGAKARYSDMVDEVAKDYKNVRDASPVLEDLNFLEKFYGTTPSKANTIVNQMKTILEENPKINLSEALEFRGDLNYLIGKASRGKERVKLKNIKKNIDSFIDSVATPQQKQQIDEAVSTYSRTMNNRDLVELVSKSTKENRAVDWMKLDKALTKENLKSPEVEIAVKIVKEFSERFKNDAKLMGASTVKGTNSESGGMLETYSYVISQLKDTFALWGNRADNLKIQGAILKSLRKSKTSLEFVDDIAKNKDIPPEISKVFDDTVKRLPKEQ